MHTEVHVHGTVSLRNGVTQPEIEQALHPWLEYVDIDGLADARSAVQDEPGIVFDRRRRALEICWTGYVGRNFQNALDAAFQLLGPYSEEAAAVEVSYYHEDGQDEHGWVFVGPTDEAIQEMQKRRLIDDVSILLARHFGEAEIGEVSALLNQLFIRRAANPVSDAERDLPRTVRVPGKRHLH
jgi:uncharacterized protein DUF6806